jgi:hypothetical protein
LSKVDAIDMPDLFFRTNKFPDKDAIVVNVVVSSGKDL